MAEDQKTPNANIPKPYIPRTNYSARNNVSYHYTPYGGSTTFRDMKKKAEQAMADHEFKA